MKNERLRLWECLAWVFFSCVIAGFLMLAVTIFIERMDRKLTAQQAEWAERVDGGMEQEIPSPPVRTRSKDSGGRVSRED